MIIDTGAFWPRGEREPLSAAQQTAQHTEAAIAAVLKARRDRKMHIRGPLVGGLWVACFLRSPGLGATGMSPEGAYRNWFTYWGKML